MIMLSRYYLLMNLVEEPQEHEVGHSPLSLIPRIFVVVRFQFYWEYQDKMHGYPQQSPHHEL